MERRKWKNTKSTIYPYPLLTQCISCPHLQHTRTLKHVPQRPPNLHFLPSKTLRNQWPLYKLLSLHQKHWQPLTLHGIVDGSGASSDMEHLDLDISTSSTSSSSLQRLEELVFLGGGGGGGGGGSVSPTFCFHFILFYFILF